jgi:hypothetical protein
MNEFLSDRHLRFARNLLVALFLLNWVAAVIFTFTRPQTPVPGTGHIYPLNEHGTIVYLTYWEHLFVGPIPAFVVFGLFMGVFLLHRARDGRSD